MFALLAHGKVEDALANAERMVAKTKDEIEQKQVRDAETHINFVHELLLAAKCYLMSKYPLLSPIRIVL